jgi:glycerol-3-phosphate dehydrogenase
LLLYDALAGFGNLPKSRMVQRRDQAFRAPLKGNARGFIYWDCTVDDSRLTVLNAVDAASAGAVIRTRAALMSATRDHRTWTAKLTNGEEVQASAIVNAAGPWLVDVEGRLGQWKRNTLKLVKGSHIVLPSLFEGEHAYMLQQPDRRIVFAIPWIGGTTMIGTTEVEVPSPENPEISADETDYLLNAANAAFVRQNRHEDISYSWAGVRPLFDNGSDDLRTTTRDYVLEVDSEGAPLLNVLGGKITTARYLAEDAMARLGKATGRSVERVTRERPFPGGHLPLDYDAFIERSRTLWPFLGTERTVRMARAYGSALGVMMAQTESESAMGCDFGHGLTVMEVDWLIEREWAQTAEDILFRRTKLGLAFDHSQRSKLARYMKDRVNAARD